VVATTTPVFSVAAQASAGRLTVSVLREMAPDELTLSHLSPGFTR
jgi:hypothetical protein